MSDENDVKSSRVESKEFRDEMRPHKEREEEDEEEGPKENQDAHNRCLTEKVQRKGEIRTLFDRKRMQEVYSYILDKVFGM